MKKRLSVLKSDRLLRVGFRCGLEKLENRILLTAQPFVGGDLVVYRVGDGTAALSNGGNPMFIDEYSPSGTLVQSIEMPFSTNPNDTQGGVTSPTANPNPIVNAGSATPSGVLQLSADGRYLTFTGYAANLPNLTGINLKASTFPRDVGRIDINGNVDTSTALVDYAVANTAAGALSTDGSHFYVFSQQVDTVRYANLGCEHVDNFGTDRHRFRSFRFDANLQRPIVRHGDRRQGLPGGCRAADQRYASIDATDGCLTGHGD